MNGFNEAKEAEFLLEDIEGSIVLGEQILIDTLVRFPKLLRLLVN